MVVSPGLPVTTALSQLASCHSWHRHALTWWRRMTRDASLETGQHPAGPGQANAACTATANLSQISSIWLSLMIKGGASSTWSPCRPSMVPPIG